MENTQALRVASMAGKVKRGNCRGGKEEDLSVKENDKPLSKRAKTPSKPLGLY